MKTLAMQPGLLAGYGLVPEVRVMKSKVGARLVREPRTCGNIAEFELRWAERMRQAIDRVMADAPEGIEPRLISVGEAGCYV